jgi:cytosolic carboxypeptidase protein 5
MEFYVLIVPMLNPDGVFLGNNRMDSIGQNLNRFYHLPDLELQPSCYAIKSLLELTRRQLFAFFDLHGHANKKSCFIFGNNIPVPRLQADSVLLAKHLSTICEHLEFKSCNFSKKQMSTKDKNEDLSKEGCARVVVHRWSNSPYCYTLETGLFKDARTD